LARVEKNDCLLCLDAVSKPILQLVLADGPLRKRRGIGPAVVILRDQIETAVLFVGEAMCGSEQDERIARAYLACKSVDDLVEVLLRRITVQCGGELHGAVKAFSRALHVGGETDGVVDCEPQWPKRKSFVRIGRSPALIDVSIDADGKHMQLRL